MQQLGQKTRAKKEICYDSRAMHLADLVTELNGK